MSRKRSSALLYLAAAIFMIGFAGLGLQAQQLSLISNDPDTFTCQTYISNPVVSEDGRMVFYQTACPELSMRYRTSGKNIVAKNLVTGEFHFVSVLPDRRNGAWARLFAISADGRFAVFGGNTGFLSGSLDITELYVRDIASNSTVRIGKVSQLGTMVSISADGEEVAFTEERPESQGPNGPLMDVMVWNRITGQRTAITAKANDLPAGSSGFSMVKISGDGRYVFFDSELEDLVANDGNGSRDVFVYDLVTATTTLVSINRSGSGAGNGDSMLRENDLDHLLRTSSHIVSSTGRYVAFGSNTTDLVPGMNVGGVFVRDIIAGTTSLISVNATGTGGLIASEPLISGDGSIAAFRQFGGDTQYPFGNPPIFFLGGVYRRNLAIGQTRLLNGQYPNNPSRNYDRCVGTDINADGNYVLYTCTSIPSGGGTATHEVFLTDARLGTTVRIGPEPPPFSYPIGVGFVTISNSGNVIAFSTSDPLVPEDTDSNNDIYIYRIGPPETRPELLGSPKTGLR